jgi:hypothetical protein
MSSLVGCHSRLSGILLRKDFGQVYPPNSRRVYPPLAAPRATRAGVTNNGIILMYSLVTFISLTKFLQQWGKKRPSVRSADDRRRQLDDFLNALLPPSHVAYK